MPDNDSFNSYYAIDDFYYGKEVRPEFLRYMQDHDLSQKIALDVGCGEGRYSVFLAARSASVLAMDMAAKGLRKLKDTASAQGLNIYPVCMDASVFAFRESVFDIVVAATILDHLNREDRLEAVKGIVRSLRPGGLLYADVFTTQDPGFLIRERSSRGRLRVSETAGFVTHYFEPGELKDLFSSMEIIMYREFEEEDLSHGQPHDHGWAILLARRW